MTLLVELPDTCVYLIKVCRVGVSYAVYNTQCLKCIASADIVSVALLSYMYFVSFIGLGHCLDREIFLVLVAAFRSCRHHYR